MHYHGHVQLARKRQLVGKRSSLLAPGRIVVVVIKTALTDCDGPLCDEISEISDVALLETFGVMRMDASGKPDEAWIRSGDSRRCTSGAEDIPGAAAGPDAHNCIGPAVPCAGYYLAAVAVERGVAEVRVTVDEPFDIPSFRGHFLSIQSKTGPAI